MTAKMFALGDALGPKLAALEARAKAVACLADKVRAALPESVPTTRDWRQLARGHHAGRSG